MKQETIGSKGTVPGFRPLIGAERWHRDDFTAEMLDGGYRPLLLDEITPDGDDAWRDHWKIWQPIEDCSKTGTREYAIPCRTKRPLPPPAVETFEAHGHIWYKHTPGDECPVEPDAKITVIHGDGDKSMLTYDSPTQWKWCKFKTDGANVIGYRFPDYPAVHTTSQQEQPQPIATIPTQFSTEQRLTSLYNDWCFLPPETVAECIADVAGVLYPTDAERCEAAFQRWFESVDYGGINKISAKITWHEAWKAAKESK